MYQQQLLVALLQRQECISNSCGSPYCKDRNVSATAAGRLIAKTGMYQQQLLVALLQRQEWISNSRLSPCCKDRIVLATATGRLIAKTECISSNNSWSPYSKTPVTQQQKFTEL
jgi:hypothetical protein